MELHIKERIYIPHMLPANVKWREFNLKQSILKKVAITEKDKQEYNIQEDQENQSLTWDAKKDLECPLSVEFTPEEKDFIKESCEKLAESSYPDDFWMTVQKIYDED